MRIGLLVTALLSVNCGLSPAPEMTCRTVCGLELDSAYEGENSPWTCEALQAAEDVALREFVAHVSPLAPGFENPALFCVRLTGWTVQPKPAAEMQAKHRQEVGGATSCRSRSIELTNTAPSSSAFTHELAHVLQNCEAGHHMWAEYGINAAVESAWQ